MGETFVVEFDGKRIEAMRDPIEALLNRGELHDYWHALFIGKDGGTKWSLHQIEGVSRGLVHVRDRGWPYDSWQAHIVVSIEELDQTETTEPLEA